MENQLMQLKNNVIALLMDATDPKEIENIYISILGKKGKFNLLIADLKNLPPEERSRVGKTANEVKQTIVEIFNQKRQSVYSLVDSKKNYFDITVPGVKMPQGHLHLVTQAINEITDIFSRIGFTRVRHPEVDWDWYAFEGLNMPPNHPARDEWETFFIKMKSSEFSLGHTRDMRNQNYKNKFSKMILTPHTSNGQVREMEKGRLPIRMINIAKNYRRQNDVSHTPMFHQFEGLYIDKNVSIAHLKGVCDYFFKQFYGPDRKSRLRPYHFQFTEPSFEIDVSCGICGGTGVLPNKEPCKLCKEGWLELGGAGMVHPTVLRNGGIDPEKYNGFAFGWGIERTYMMKVKNIDDVRLFYTNDIRFLEQF
jgi:phenylalanyl-tRNA synthetase alpha chain